MSSCCVDKLLGKWEEEAKNGDVEAFTKTVSGASESKTGFCCKSSLQYEKDGDKWKLIVGTVGKPDRKEYTFRLGETFDSYLNLGAPMATVVKAEGKGLREIHTFKEGDSKGDQLQVTRYIDPKDRMHVDMECKGASLELLLKRV